MRILVVDVEPVSRYKLKKILELYGSVALCENGTAAVHAYRDSWQKGVPYDLLMLDFLLPDMSGTVALRAIRDIEEKGNSPHKARVFILASMLDRNTIVCAAKSGCNGLVVKPFNAEVIAEKLKEAGITAPENREEAGQGRVRRDVLKIIEKFKSGDIELPILPDVVHETNRVIADPDSTIKDISNTIEKDTVVSAELIAFANSPRYRGVTKVQTVTQAINRLGFMETRNVILTIVNRKFYRTDNKLVFPTMEKMRMYSLASAHGAGYLAATLGIKHAQRYFMMGLLHNIGNVLLLWMLAGIGLQENLISLDNVVREINRLQAAFGAVLLKRWQFDDNVVNVARFHQGPDFTPDTPVEVLIVNLAGNIAFHIGYGFYDREKNDPTELPSARLLGFSRDKLKSLVSIIKSTVEESEDPE
jgi:HD-like signal output (HDOD) protein/ActR/RegA family two-component response regulator